MRLLVLPKLHCVLKTNLNRWTRRPDFLNWSSCIGFFVCPCYIRITHYPTLEKLGPQNKAVCDNQGKQHQWGDHWKTIKMLLWKEKKNNKRWCINDKKIDWNTCFNKISYILQTWKRKWESYLNQSTIDRSRLIYS